MSTVYEIEKLIADLGEEDYYNENIIDERLPLTAETTPTDDLLPSHYKTLRKMIDFIKNCEELKEENEKLNEKIIEEYMKSLTDKEVITLNIAKEHLGSSFDLVKCIGFQKWLKKDEK